MGSLSLHPQRLPPSAGPTSPAGRAAVGDRGLSYRALRPCSTGGWAPSDAHAGPRVRAGRLESLSPLPSSVRDKALATPVHFLCTHSRALSYPDKHLVLHLLHYLVPHPLPFILRVRGHYPVFFQGKETGLTAIGSWLSLVRTQTRTPAQQRAHWTRTEATPSPPVTTFNPHPHCPSLPIFKLSVPTPPSHEQGATQTCDGREGPTVDTLPLAAGRYHSAL